MCSLILPDLLHKLSSDYKISLLPAGRGHVFACCTANKLLKGVMHPRIVWPQVPAAKLGQEQEPCSMARIPFWSHPKQAVHVGGDGSEKWGCYFTTPPPPQSLPHRLLSFVFGPVASQALFESFVPAVWQRWGRLLSCPRLLTWSARVWSPPFQAFFFPFSFFFSPTQHVWCTWPTECKSVKEMTPKFITFQWGYCIYSNSPVKDKCLDVS